MNLLAHSRPATHRQLNAMRAVARNYGIDHLERSILLFNKEPDELSEYEAGVFIDYLRVAPNDNQFKNSVEQLISAIKNYDGCSADVCRYDLDEKIESSFPFIGKIVEPTKPHEVASKDC